MNGTAALLITADRTVRAAIVAVAETAAQAERWQKCEFPHRFGDMTLASMANSDRYAMTSLGMQTDHGHWPTLQRAMRAAGVCFRSDLPLWAHADLPDPLPQSVPGTAPVFGRLGLQLDHA